MLNRKHLTPVEVDRLLASTHYGPILFEIIV